MDLARLFAPWSSLGLVLLSAIAVYLSVVICTRLAGPRSLASMSSFDFAATVAIGSTVATVSNLSSPLAHGLVTIAVLYLAQLGAAFVRNRGRAAERIMDNSPVLLMRKGEVLEGQLAGAHLSHNELWAQLRAAGIRQFDEVEAAVLETNGEISVIRTAEVPLDTRLLEGVKSPG